MIDINECTTNPDICGLGDCGNNVDGTFYECDCQNGATITGTNSDGSLTCIGMYICISLLLVAAHTAGISILAAIISCKLDTCKLFYAYK